MNDSVAIQCTKLTKVYASATGAVTALADLDFILHSGESCAVVGPSGSGKTTMLALCAGLDTPTSGSVVLAGQNLADLDEDGRAQLRAERVGFVFQQYQLVPSLSALDNVTLPLEILGGVPLKECRDRARELLHEVGLTQRLDHYPAQLSGGEQQRVALARAFVNRPRVLFADEPTGNLDSENASRALALMARLTEQLSTALLLVTHDSAVANRLGRTLTLAYGRVAA